MYNQQCETRQALRQYAKDLRRSKHRVRRYSEQGQITGAISPQRPTGHGHVTFDMSHRPSIDQVVRGRGSDREGESHDRPRYKRQTSELSYEAASRIGEEIDMTVEGSLHAGTIYDPVTGRRWRCSRLEDQHTDRAPTFAHKTMAKSTITGSIVHHQDTFALRSIHKSHGSQNRQNDLSTPPYGVVGVLVQHTDHSTYLSLRLVSRSWRMAVDNAQSPRFPAVYKLPSEVILQIYTCIVAEEHDSRIDALAAIIDFNNARHTCRAWMDASLDKKLLAQAFFVAGWWDRVCMHIVGFLSDQYTEENDAPQIWHMSALLAKECDRVSSDGPDGLGEDDLADIEDEYCPESEDREVDGV